MYKAVVALCLIQENFMEEIPLTVLRCTVIAIALLMIAPAIALELAVVVPTPDSVQAEPTMGPSAIDGTEGRDSRAVVRNWDVVLAYEFGPTKNQVEDMMGALERASQDLYDTTDGQFRFKHADIWTHGKNFNNADTQIKVLDVGPGYRANAIRGGIAIPGTNINLGTTNFGMLWNTSMGGMTIAHEWGHFGLYLPDEYDDVQQGQYIISVPWCNNCLMSNGTNVDLDSELCTVDNHNVTNPHAEAKSCWEQVKQHYPTTSQPTLHANIVQDGPYYPPSEKMSFTIHYPDLYILPSDITMTPANPKEGDQVTLTAKVHNKDTILSGQVIEIRFYDGPIADGKQIASKSISISGQETDTVTTTWIATGGYRDIFVTVDPNNVVTEWEDYSNNTANKTFHVLAKPKITCMKMDKTAVEDAVISLNLKACESDVESTDPNLLWTVSFFDPAFIASVSGENSAQDIINITPVAEYSGKTAIDITLTDGDSMTTTKMVNLTWTPFKDPPGVHGISLSQNWVYRTNSVQISFNGSDPDSDSASLTPTLELKHSSAYTWTPLTALYDGTIWKVQYTPALTAQLGTYDIRASLTDLDSNIGEMFYANASLNILDSPPAITDLSAESNTAYRGQKLNITVEGGDIEEDQDDLKVELEFKPSSSGEWTYGGSFNYKTGHLSSGKWSIPFLTSSTAKLGNYDLRLRLNDSIRPGAWSFINKTIQVKNSLPVVTEFASDEPDVHSVLRTRTFNMTIKGNDFETSLEKLTLSIEYSIGNQNDWSPLPSTQSKVTLDTAGKFWTVAYTPRKDVESGIYHIRAYLKDSDNEKGPATDLSGDLDVQNNPPNIKYTARTSTKTGEVVVFDATSSTDIEDPITSLKYEWDFKDGSAKSTKSRVSHVFNKAGKYDVTLKVTDKNGGISTTKITVTVGQGSVISSGDGLSATVLGIIAAVVIVVVLVVVFLVMKKKGLGPFKK